MLQKRSHRILALAGMTLAACVDPQEPPPLTITIAASPTSVTVGQTVSFRAEAQGFDIVRIAVVLGDGEAESFDFPGLTSAHATFPHAFTSPGAFDVTATVTNFQNVRRSSAVRVTVSAVAP